MESKRRARALWTAYFLGALSGLALMALAFEIHGRRSPDVRLYREVRNLIRENWVEEADNEELLDAALTGMVSSLDTYSRYYPREELNRLSRETNGTFTGIGVVFKAPSSELRVLFPTPGSPAYGKIRVGDRLVALNGEPVTEFSTGELQERIASSDGQEIMLEVEARNGTRRTETLTPARIIDPTVQHAALLDEELGIAYCAITGFSRETPAEFDAAVEQLREHRLRGLIVDLRDNRGGVLRSAIEIANRFIDEGIIVSTRSRHRSRAYLAKPEMATLLGMPLVLLVDGGSASASEVLTGAIQDHRVGAVVGTSTYGKGMVQTLQPYGDRAVVKLTTSLYYTPANRQIDRSYSSECDVGIDPDLLVPIAEEERLRVHARLARFSPPRELVAEIEGWETEEGIELLPKWPGDRQLDAALALFAGSRNGKLDFEFGASAR